MHHARKLFKLPNSRSKEVPIGPKFDVDPIGFKPIASSKEIRHATKFKEAYIQQAFQIMCIINMLDHQA